MTFNISGLLAALGLILSTSAQATIDGKQPVLCANVEILECVPDQGCERVSAKDANLPRFLKIDFDKGTITRSRPDGTNLSSKIERSETVDERIILQGAEDGAEDQRDSFGWSLAIDMTNGEMVLTGSGHDVGFVIFGACEAL